VRASFAATVAVVVAAHLAFAARAVPAYDVRARARVVGEAMRSGRPVASVGRHDGQLTFAARLDRPLAVVAPADAAAWLARHPDGLLVRRGRGARTGAPRGAARGAADGYRGVVLVSGAP